MPFLNYYLPCYELRLNPKKQKHKNTYLWLLDEGEDMRKNILSHVDKRIDKKRIIFAERVDRGRHLARIMNIDVALDTRIYNGHTTSIEMLMSLWNSKVNPHMPPNFQIPIGGYDA